jgi:alcohol dehydrogenase
MIPVFDYHIPTKVLFGPGTLERLATEPLPGKRALLVISAGTAMRRHGYLDRVTGLLEKAGASWVLFDRILPNPIKAHVMEGAALARREGCDFVLGLGGGSTIDSAKSIAVMAVNPGDYWDYIGSGSGKGLPVTNGALPIVAITTTAGTGTEADPWTVITHEERHEKIGWGLVPETFPALSIVDPELMLTVPPLMTAYQGFDAFHHAAEGVIATIATPLSDAFALTSIELLRKWLPVAVKDGGNLEARTNVALANTLSGMVESTSGCTSEHSMEHALSARNPDLPHGAGLIMLSRAYFGHFAQTAPERLAKMAPAMGVDTRGMTDGQAARAFVQAMADLQDACGVGDLRLSDYGITADDAPELAREAVRTMGGLFSIDPTPLSLEDTAGIIAASCR